MRSEYDRLRDLTWNAKKTGVTSDDLSQAMEPFIREIHDLAMLDSGKALWLGYYLMNTLRAYSYAEMGLHASGYGERPSDEPADEITSRIVLDRVKVGETWDSARDLKYIKAEAKTMGDHGVEPWYSEPRRFSKNSARLKQSKW